MKEERLYIVGYMACGKTTFGRALANRMGWDFVDLDEKIARQEGQTVREIIESKGEAQFRQMECHALKHTASIKKVIVACGGGTPCYRDNMEFMTLHGHTLWLLASPAKILERVREVGDTRPLLNGKDDEELMDFIIQHLRQRQPYYCKAMWRLGGDHLETDEEIIQTVDEFLSEHDIQTE